MGSGTDYKLGFKSTANNSAGNNTEDNNSGTPSLTSSPAPAVGSSGGGGGGSGVMQISAGTGIGVSPAGGTGVVTISSTISQIFFDVSTFASVNAAVAALNANGGGTLYFQKGAYSVTGVPTAITVPSTVLADGWGCTSLSQTDGTNPAMIINCAGPNTVRGLNFVSGGTYALQMTYTSAPSFISHPYVSECQFLSATNGLYLNAAFSVVRDCNFGCTTGAYFTNLGNLDESAGLISGCTFASSGQGVYALADGLQITDNYFYGGNYAVVFSVTAAANLVDLWINDNHIENQAVAAISLQGPSGSGSFSCVVIVGNEFNSEGQTTGIILDTSAGSPVANWLSNLTFTGNVVGDFGTFGIKLYNASLVTIAGNTFSSNLTGTAIYIDASCSNGAAGSTNVYNVPSGTKITNNGGFVTT
jgi:Right handed beta helix region